MVNDLERYGLAPLRVEQGGPASLGKYVLTATTAQAAEAVTAIPLADDQMALARLATVLAC